MTWHLLADHGGRAIDMNVTPATVADWRQAADLAAGQVLPFRNSLPRPVALRLPADLSAEEYFA